MRYYYWCHTMCSTIILFRVTVLSTFLCHTVYFNTDVNWKLHDIIYLRQIKRVFASTICLSLRDAQFYRCQTLPTVPPTGTAEGKFSSYMHQACDEYGLVSSVWCVGLCGVLFLLQSSQLYDDDMRPLFDLRPD